MNSMQSWIARPSGKKKLIPALFCLFALGVIGFIDYAIGYQISIIVLYVLPIGFATLYVGRVFAVILAILSVVIWMGGDLLAGAPYLGVTTQFWNGGIVFSLFVIVIYLLNALRQALVGLEAIVEDRTQALRLEMKERERLEYEILDLSERERQSFGQELHDAVCQELAGTAIAGQMLTKKLQDKGIDEAREAGEVTEMIFRSLTKARNVARGFFTAGFDALGLADALRETVANAGEQSGMRCEFTWQENLSISDEEVVMHFFRIAQEAIQNALKHSEATRLRVSLESVNGAVQLIVEDNGKGLSGADNSRKGLGLRIMAYRAGLIGGNLKLEKCPEGGTRIVCLVPQEKMLANNALGHET
jgi:signal transduction histidine kinase